MKRIPKITNSNTNKHVFKYKQTMAIITCITTSWSINHCDDISDDMNK